MSKRWLPACGVAVLLAVSLLTGCAGTSPDLRGSWILVSDGEHRFPAGATPGPGDIVKLVTDDTFATTGRAAGKFDGGAGTWSCRDGVYTECVRIHSNEALMGEKIEFSCLVEGDLCHHAADFVAKGRRYVIDEVWRRLGRQTCGIAQSDAATP